ncbi:hypothetical protein [Streptomyces sp. F001]|uniref:hypothetical protein n=1 Tax=Streptomyces sp. F001 TaxID=1510026 RepID=UPI00101E57B5|nr:hypothetical protein [Streptomyces sp. F001]
MPFVIINKVKCNETTDGAGADDLQIKIDGVLVFGGPRGTAIDSGQEKIVNQSRAFDTIAKVSLWEWDSGSGDDHIGSFFVSASQVDDGERAFNLIGDGSDYDVFYQVEEAFNP